MILASGAAERIFGIRSLVRRKWERWFVAKVLSSPSSVIAYGPQPPALLIITSIRGIDVSLRMVLAADLTLDIELRLTGTSLVTMEELMAWIESSVGWILTSERPRRSMVEGEPWARVIAVSAPTPPLLGPVTRKTRPLTWASKSETIVVPSVAKP